MRKGDLCQVAVPLSAHPQVGYLHGMLAIIIGEPYKTSAYQHTYIKCLCDCIRMIPTNWLEVLQ